jgi:acetyltransferase
MEAAELLQCYAIPVAPISLALSADAAVEIAAPYLSRGEAVAVKIHSRDIIHKSDVDGVRLNLTSAAAVRQAVDDVIARATTALPRARITGVMVQPMIRRPKARELIVGIADDPTFGPVIVFGQGGTAVEAIGDKALSLPPLDLNLARDLIARTRVARILGAYRNVPAVQQDAVALTLVKLAQLAADVPEICELDINPLLGDEMGILALDARVAIAPVAAASPVRHPTVSKRLGATRCHRWNRERVDPPHPAARRGSVPGFFPTRFTRRPAPAVFCPGQGIHPCFHCTIDAA